MLRRTCLVAAPLFLLAHSGQAFAQAQSQSTVAPAAVAAPAAAPDVLAPAGTALTWLGHSAWLVRSPTGTTILIDPWLDNPRKPVDFVLPEHVDAIVVTHGHADHVGEAVALAEKMHAPVVGSFELIEALGLKDGIGTNPGGTVTIKDIELHLTQAIHSSSVAMARPPLPSAASVQGAKETCDCPDHALCAEQHHHDHFVHKAAELDGEHKQHNKKSEGHKGHHHKRKNKRSGTSHEAQELVVGENAAGEKMGRAQSAVAEGIALAKKAEAHDASSDASGPCNCGPDKAMMHHHKPRFAYAGAPMGVILKVTDGPTIYHAGDTDLFLDMGLIKRRYAPSVALLPIGGHYTMGPKDAAMAASMLGVHDVVPMHYGTSPLLSGTPEALKDALEDEQRMIAPRPGATISYPKSR